MESGVIAIYAVGLALGFVVYLRLDPPNRTNSRRYANSHPKAVRQRDSCCLNEMLNGDENTKCKRNENGIRSREGTSPALSWFLFPPTKTICEVNS